jgi:hypothetical protein
MNQDLISNLTIYTSQIYFNSSQANILGNGTKKSQLSFIIKDIVSLEKKCLEVRLSLVNAQIPYSFYKINLYGNKINIYQSSVWTTYYSVNFHQVIIVLHSL